MGTNVPAAFQQYVNEAAQGTGLSPALVAAQANMESGFQANSTSSTNAQGWLQFEPGTYDAYAAKAGVPTGTEYNVADETKVYVVFMNQLLHDEGGSIFKALEAYNAGEGDLGAGAGYASTIMSNAGVSQGASDAGGPGASTVGGGGGTPAQDTSLLSNLFNVNLGDIFTKPFEGILSWTGHNLLGQIGVPDFKDMLQRLGLMAFGGIVILVGLVMLVKGDVKPVVNVVTGTGSSPPARAVRSSKEMVTSPLKSAPEQSASKPARTELINTPQGTREVPEGKVSRSIRESKERTTAPATIRTMERA